MTDIILKALRTADWAMQDYGPAAGCEYCPACGGAKKQYNNSSPPGHKPDCTTAAAIVEAEAMTDVPKTNAYDPIFTSGTMLKAVEMKIDYRQRAEAAEAEVARLELAATHENEARELARLAVGLTGGLFADQNADHYSVADMVGDTRSFLAEARKQVKENG